jgi:hypothetical protein
MKIQLVNLKLTKIISVLILVLTISCNKTEEKPLPLLNSQWEFNDIDDIYIIKFLSESEFVVTYIKAIDNSTEKVNGKYTLNDSIITIVGNNRIEKGIVSKDKISFYNNQTFLKKNTHNNGYN